MKSSLFEEPILRVERKHLSKFEMKTRGIEAIPFPYIVHMGIFIYNLGFNLPYI